MVSDSASPARSLNRWVLAALSFVVAAGLVVIAPPPGSAAVPSAPIGLSPDGGTFSAVPLLTWDRDPEARSYEVQVSLSEAFTSTLWTRTTVNTHAAPPVQLPEGRIYWRVRVTTDGGRSDWSERSFLRSKPTTPAPVSPVDAQELTQPGQSPVLVWQPVAGASGYTVRVSADSSFVDPQQTKTYTTSQSSYALTILGAPNVYYWQVRADFGAGVTSAWSDPSSYTLKGLAIPTKWTPRSPEYSDDLPDAIESVTDAVLDWDAIEGAATYEIRISTDQNFATIVDQRSGVTGTSYARPVTLDNDAYWWQVRPVDAFGGTVAWDRMPTWKFARHWPDQPRLLYPGNGTTVGDPFFFQWAGATGRPVGAQTAGVQHASQYVLEISTSSSFDRPLYDTCTTNHLTYTPTSSSDCMPAAPGTYYWRVRATDGAPSTVQTAGNYDIFRFNYVPETVAQVAPINGDPTSLPVLSWEPLAGAAEYAVTVTDASSAKVVASAVTAATTFTPRTVLAAGTYRWQVQTVTQDGRTGSSLAFLDQPTFEVVPAGPSSTTAAPTPLPDSASSAGGAFTRFPLLRWSRVDGADRYYVSLRPVGGVAFTRLSGVFTYPTGEDLGTAWLTPGTYEWRVEAFAGGTPLTTTGAADYGDFSIVGPEEVTGHRVALNGTALGDGFGGDATSTCDATLPVSCQDLRQTPVLSWEPAGPETGYYQVYLSNNAELTNLLPGYPRLVQSTVFTPTTDLADAQAQAAYYWEVVPCTASQCADKKTASHAFNKRSDPVVLTGPGAPHDPAAPLDPETNPEQNEVADDVTLSWEDYLVSSQRQVVGTPLTTMPNQDADKYVVQTATDPGFVAILETATVDQTSFTSYATTYPEGLVYWRVRAVDKSGNNLPWSQTYVFEKRSPVVDLAGSTVQDPANGTQRFFWTPLLYAASYDLEVYKNNDRQPSAANLMLSASSRLVTYTAVSPLPVSPTAYTWRVRRVDAKGRKGDWSALTPFLISGTGPVPLSPVPDENVAPSDSVFTWNAAPRAESYRFERRLIGGVLAESVITPALAWAPTAALAGGSWEWRVVALDTAGRELGAAEWSRFTVIDRPVAVDGVGVSGVAQVGQLLSAVGPNWGADAAEISTTFQWLRAGRAIVGATESSYRLTPDDLTRAITVQATGRRAGYLDRVIVSDAVTPTTGPPLAPESAPSISGTGRVGSTLASTSGSWPGTPRFTYQWYRDGKPITGATRSDYTVQAADAGYRVALLVTATQPGYEPGLAVGGPVAIAALASRLETTLSATRAPRTQRVVATSRVVVSGLASPIGTVTFFDGRKKLRSVTVSSGIASLTLPRLTTGRHVIKTVYSGSRQTGRATAKTVLTITRR